jgi:stage III sporulation protein AB
LDYKITPAIELVDSALCSENIRFLDFISGENLLSKKEVNSPLSKEENDEISQFLFMLGKSDVVSQKKLITGFKSYINNALEAYKAKYKKDSKIYASFGFFFACALTILWS